MYAKDDPARERKKEWIHKKKTICIVRGESSEPRRLSVPTPVCTCTMRIRLFAIKGMRFCHTRQVSHHVRVRVFHRPMPLLLDLNLNANREQNKNNKSKLISSALHAQHTAHTHHVSKSYNNERHFHFTSPIVSALSVTSPMRASTPWRWAFHFCIHHPNGCHRQANIDSIALRPNGENHFRWKYVVYLPAYAY